MGEAKNRRAAGGGTPRRSKGKKPLHITAVVLGVVAVLVGLYLLLTPRPAADHLPVAAANAGPFPAALDQYGISLGAADAPVVVREFADYQCPACGNFAAAVAKLIPEYVDTGKVRLVYFDLPLRMHNNAVPAAMAARCAGDQNAYWDMNKQIYAKQGEWSSASRPVDAFTRYARGLGLEERRFRRCMSTDLHLEAIQQSRDVAMQLQVTSTPTVLVDNIRLTRPGWVQLQAVVDRELARLSR
ncbi:DsbA family protein [Marinobacter sp. X15-166B]|uniref:DsbA family protein n=1 Tax=Marinobacter sp. X15-166B TaxID=1897620 RepID=UPI00085CBF00|nr:thioredoxin domain-containing protein [Marinobacter sp. X15-166B]OEY65474.1 disulfide bond formation protein DsbA [Marinobacter sp. X15-166B]